MRDILILAIIFGLAPFCFINSYFGVLMWTWVAYFNPHRLAFGIAYNFPVAWVVGLPTLAGILLTSQKNLRMWTRESLLLLCLWLWFVITTLYASQQAIFAASSLDARAELIEISKVLLMTFVSVLLVTSREKLKYLCLVISLSIGFYAFKGAIFGVLTGGQSRIYGPPDSFLYDNNDLALAMNMTLPILFFMAREVESRFLRIFLRVLFVCGIVCVILSYSRGGLLGLGLVLALIAFRSRHKLIAVAALVTLPLVVIAFAPPAWMDRMGNFFHGNLDQSAEGRLNAWQFSYVLAQRYPITGGGFQVFTPELFQRFTPELPFAGPHSIYFQLLGEQGFVGLGLFLLLLGFCWLTLRRIRKGARYFESCHWMRNYVFMLEGSLLGYMVTGAFLPRAYFDYYYQLVAIIIVLKILFRQEVALAMSQTEEQLVPAIAVATAEGITEDGWWPLPLDSASEAPRD